MFIAHGTISHIVFFIFLIISLGYLLNFHKNSFAWYGSSFCGCVNNRNYRIKTP